MESVKSNQSPPDVLGMTTKNEVLSKRVQEINEHMQKLDRMMALSGKQVDFPTRLAMSIELLLTQVVDLQERVKALESHATILIPPGGAL